VAELAPGLEVAPAPESKLHTVVAGDTLFSIARRYNTSVSALKLANPAVIYSVQVGQILLLPLSIVETQAPQSTAVAEAPLKKVAFTEKIRDKDKNKPRYYTIKRGDTLHSVARLFDVDLSALKNWNPKLGKSRGIQPGKRIVVGM
jgi:LysM repeat protein